VLGAETNKMPTGRDTQLTRQIGEHLVAAKLGRLGYIAAPFAGNVPLFDLLAADVRGFSIPIQVKAINGFSWQLRADTFLEIEIVGDVQHIKGKKKLLNPDLLCIFVLLGEDEKNVFYIFQLKDLQEHIFKNYKGGRRPKNPNSMHCAVWPKDLEEFRDNWGLVAAQFPA
jgi:hypothetical protein